MRGPPVPDDRRRLLLRAALGFIQLEARAPEPNAWCPSGARRDCRIARDAGDS